MGVGEIHVDESPWRRQRSMSMKQKSMSMKVMSMKQKSDELTRGLDSVDESHVDEGQEVITDYGEMLLVR